MFLYFVLGFAVLACLGEVYLLVSYVRCQGKYPPFINSFGKVREDILQKAEEILQPREFETAHIKQSVLFDRKRLISAAPSNRDYCI